MLDQLYEYCISSTSVWCVFYKSIYIDFVVITLLRVCIPIIKALRINALALKSYSYIATELAT